MDPAAWIVIGCGVGLPLAWGAAAYAQLASNRSATRQAWADIDSELRRRHDLVPTLAEVVRGHCVEDRGALDDLLRQRDAAAGIRDPDARGVAESYLAAAIGLAFALAQRHPRLRADSAFLRVQELLAAAEDRVAGSRRAYDDAIGARRRLLRRFPTSLVARVCGFDEGRPFQLAREAERVVPRANLSMTQPQIDAL